MTDSAIRPTNFRVVVDTHSIHRSDRGQFSGIIFVELNGGAFPESTWSDSVVAVLHSWAQSLLQLRRQEVAFSRLSFMDGPFAIDIRSTAAGQWSINCLRTDRGSTIIEGSCDPGEVVGAYLSALEFVLSECSRRAWTSADLVELSMMRKKLLAT